MKAKRVWRYYCDYCKKSGCSGAAIKKHELHCTMNPERKCRMCELIDINQEPIITLFGALDSEGLAGLRFAADDCPVCIFAALRQREKFNRKRVWEYGFDLKKEVQIVFDNLQEQIDERDSFYPY